MSILRRIFTRTPAKTVVTRGYTNRRTPIVNTRFPAKEGYRKDLDKNFRSKMESNVYRYLTECHPDLCLVEYEPHLFTHADGLPKGFNYLPDFRCTTHTGYQFYIEVKGVMDARSQDKLEVMKTYRPDIDLRVVGDEVYQKIRKRFSKVTRGWEN